jgi:Leucine-rich repeat (LRR) protein
LGYTDESIDVIAELKKLKSLNLGGNPITDAGVGKLAANLPDLEKVDLTGTNISDNAVRLLTACSKLQRLSVEATGTTDKCIEHLKKMENLKYFICGRTKISEAGIAELKQALPNCTVWK